MDFKLGEFYPHCGALTNIFLCFCLLVEKIIKTLFYNYIIAVDINNKQLKSIKQIQITKKELKKNKNMQGLKYKHKPN